MKYNQFTDADDHEYSFGGKRMENKSHSALTIGYRADLYIAMPCSLEGDPPEGFSMPCGPDGEPPEGFIKTFDDHAGMPDGECDPGGADDTDSTDKPLPDQHTGYLTDYMMMFVEELARKVEQEFDSEISENIEHRYYGGITLHIEGDRDSENEDGSSPRFLNDEQEAFVVMSRCKNTETVLLFVVAPDIKVGYITDYLDQVSRGEIKIKEGGRSYSLMCRLNGRKDEDCENENCANLCINKKKEFPLRPAGKAYYAVCMTKPDEETFTDQQRIEWKRELRCLISGETRNNEDNVIKSRDVDRQLRVNHAQYECYDLFLSEYSALCLMEGMSEKFSGNDYATRLDIECLLIFIIELVVLKITAIHRANDDVLDAFSKFTRKSNNSANEESSEDKATGGGHEEGTPENDKTENGKAENGKADNDKTENDKAENGKAKKGKRKKAKRTEDESEVISSLENIVRITSKFTETLRLWDVRHFRYGNAQTEAGKIEASFRVSNYLSNYEKNFEYLENIVNIRNLIASEKENMISEKENKNLGRIGVVLAIFALFQIIPNIQEIIEGFEWLYYRFIRNSPNLAAIDWERFFSYVSIVVLAVILCVVAFRDKMKRCIEKLAGKFRRKRK